MKLYIEMNTRAAKRRREHIHNELQQPSYSRLPEHILGDICMLLDEKSVISCLMVCKRWYNAITGDELLWRDLLRKKQSEHPSLMNYMGPKYCESTNNSSAYMGFCKINNDLSKADYNWSKGRAQTYVLDTTECTNPFYVKVCADTICVSNEGLSEFSFYDARLSTHIQTIEYSDPDQVGLYDFLFDRETIILIKKLSDLVVLDVSMASDDITGHTFECEWAIAYHDKYLVVVQSLAVGGLLRFTLYSFHNGVSKIPYAVFDSETFGITAPSIDDYFLHGSKLVIATEQLTLQMYLFDLKSQPTSYKIAKKADWSLPKCRSHKVRIKAILRDDIVVFQHIDTNGVFKAYLVKFYDENSWIGVIDLSIKPDRYFVLPEVNKLVVCDRSMNCLMFSIDDIENENKPRNSAIRYITMMCHRCRRRYNNGYYGLYFQDFFSTQIERNGNYDALKITIKRYL